VIKYRLSCQSGHDFESWFRAIDDYDAQLLRGLIACPTCGSAEISKQPMAPAVVSSRDRQKSATPVEIPADVVSKLRALKQTVVENSEDVGTRFADEARKMHFGEAEERNIRGNSTPEEARGLAEDGVPFGILPGLPEDLN
jgi:hypothetical protein